MKTKGIFIMFNVPYEKMICDTNKGDGGINFYEEYCEWMNRYNGDSFKIFYRDIDDVKIVSGLKKTVIVTLKSGEAFKFYLYRAATFRELLYKAVQRVNGEVTEDEKEVKQMEEAKEESDSEDYISKLERLAKLHESGFLNDEELAAAKQKLLK